ncbi:hypothetical protein M2165_002387 [Variovorax sp. TBS-050B]|uniref:hypothetical protein n=1 Tax=Variovorax sp. TBS-050B TaxID=2940551 RepID=UPI002473D89C|nr:hypothetical protein [Variovorax sp. TBS-050B]MDH6592498.1 hypothetical protein [Variovorax sp. TBS-050B]
MKKLLSLVVSTAALGACLSFGAAHAQDKAATAPATAAPTASAAGAGCEAKAVDKNGKALAGAAKASFVKKCEKEAKSAAAPACAAKAVDKNGKALAGAAKNSFMKKCEADAAKG